MKYSFVDDITNTDICNVEIPDTLMIVEGCYVILPFESDSNEMYRVMKVCIDIPNEIIWVYVLEFEEYKLSIG